MHYLRLRSVIMMLCLLLVTLLLGGTFQSKFQVVWTNEEEAGFLTEEEHKVAFRDVVLEGMAKRLFDVYMTNSRLRDIKKLPQNLMLSDPLEIRDEINFNKKQAGLIDMDFKAWDLKIRKVS